MWPSLCSDLDRLVNTIATKVEPDAPCLGNASFVLCTDASDTGFGAILFDSDGAWKMFNGRWNINEIHEIIAVKELLAILKAIEHWQIASSFHLLCDNTIALAALAKGYSPHFCINAVVSAIFDEVRSRFGERCVASWVPSADNVADAPSRSCLRFDEQQAVACLAVAWGGGSKAPFAS